ncbi:ABC transporter substrate binding protein [Magnetococcus sp. PR-3]|uniref:ABC transporter substrate binding protein n=1 Tax=Magnetococcus sp. PR-3 TaxID=3120355 RepID=UPI002FCE46A6
MNRYREGMILLFALLFMGWGGQGQAAPKKRLVLIQSMPVVSVLSHSQHFIIHLKKQGWIPGKNLDLIILRPLGDAQTTLTQLKEILNSRSVDLVATSGSMASVVAFKVLEEYDVPQLFFTVSDPVGAGLIQHAGQPSGSYISGVINSLSRSLKLSTAIRLLQWPAKKPLRLGYIYTDYPSSLGDLRALQKAAQSYPGVKLVPKKIDYRPIPAQLSRLMEDAKTAVKQLEAQVDFWWQPLGPLGQLQDFTQLLQTRSIRPILYGTTMEAVKRGALFQINPNSQATGMDAAVKADAILRGQPAGTLPVVAASRFDLGVNITTTLQMKTTIPAELLDLAGEHVYRTLKP